MKNCILKRFTVIFKHYIILNGIFNLNRFPGLNTISENINNASNETRQFIFDAQIRFIVAESLDDFQALTIDSTAVSANSAWPTESRIMKGLVCRFYHRGKNLDKLGMKNISDKKFSVIIKEMKELSKRIQFVSGKRDAKKKRKKLYNKILKEAEKAVNDFTPELDKVSENLKRVNQPPSHYKMAAQFVELMKKDLDSLKEAWLYSKEIN
jgi:hypothetical protein